MIVIFLFWKDLGYKYAVKHADENLEAWGGKNWKGMGFQWVTQIWILVVLLLLISQQWEFSEYSANVSLVQGKKKKRNQETTIVMEIMIIFRER